MTDQPILTVQDLDAYLAGDKETRLAQVTAAVRAYCEWHVAPPITQTVTVYGDGSRVLLLPSLHVTAVASVKVDGTDIDPDSYQWRPNGVLTGRTWPADSPVDVELTHGYETAPDVAGVLAEMVGARSSSPTGQAPTSVSLGSARVSYGTASGVDLRSIATPGQMAVLDRYKLPPRP